MFISASMKFTKKIGYGTTENIGPFRKLVEKKNFFFQISILKELMSVISRRKIQRLYSGESETQILYTYFITQCN
jgi:hypothetical protein